MLLPDVDSKQSSLVRAWTGLERARPAIIFCFPLPMQNRKRDPAGRYRDWRRCGTGEYFTVVAVGGWPAPRERHLSSLAWRRSLLPVSFLIGSAMRYPQGLVEVVVVSFGSVVFRSPHFRGRRRIQPFACRMTCVHSYVSVTSCTGWLV